MLTPSEHWVWHYCQEADRLLLTLSASSSFTSELTGAVLNQKIVSQPFSLEEAEAFWRFHDVLLPLPLSDEEREQFALHALANRYRQLSAHKSWYFVTQRQQDIGLYQLVQLQGKDIIPALVVASDLECIECLLLTKGETLAGKLLTRGTVIRVLRNRAQFFEMNVDFAQTA
ncbi:cell division protein ZapC [Rheinheimera sp. UJ51]|uniref:cell division protein ZapC domain-containing protein n=1 Tax=Rheinheimera sp. UJ51 TaxID=2892446 RepID=UPI001E29AC97|nr:cell division protein ZapC domain-containing protein [Rheinheimera sp. UJ51]MCC5451655.1 cell division protein ZapC [Rheinheimera sp. UJ51]